MVWWSNKIRFMPVEGARTIDQECCNCGNRTAHVLHFAKSGVGFGNPITGKLWVSTSKQWVLVCPVCEQGDPVDKQVAKDLTGGN